MTDTIYHLGIDLGGTKTEVILLKPDGEVVCRHRRSTPRATAPEKEYADILGHVLTLIQETTAMVPASAACTIGIGIPGTIDARTGLVQNANTAGLVGKPFKQDLERVLGHPVAMDNDANCFTLAEATGGAGKGYGMVFGVIMGTGCGGGLCIDGRIHGGRHSIAGEWGHFSVDPGGAPCYCGNSGCVETKISGSGVERNYQNRFGRRLTMQQITQGYRDGDRGCRSVFDQFLDDFGRCLGGLISTLDPDAVVIGGGLSNIDALYSTGLEKIRSYAFHGHVGTPVIKNMPGDSAGVFGAARIGEYTQ